MPSVFNRKFGCEFEFSSKMEVVEPIAQEIITFVYGKKRFVSKPFTYSSVKNAKWHLKLDGSTECELITPISTINDIDKILMVVDYLHRNNIKITSKDSLHIHVQANDVATKNAILAWIQIENIILKWFKLHRQNNDYCTHLIPKYVTNITLCDNTSSLYDDIIDRAINHHSAMSLFHYKNRHTIEFRLSHASFDLLFIEGWIKFCMHFLNYAHKLKTCHPIQSYIHAINDINQIITMFNIKDNHTLYFLRHLTKNKQGRKPVKKE